MNLKSEVWFFKKKWKKTNQTNSLQISFQTHSCETHEHLLKYDWQSDEICYIQQPFRFAQQLGFPIRQTKQDTKSANMSCPVASLGFKIWTGFISAHHTFLFDLSEWSNDTLECHSFTIAHGWKWQPSCLPHMSNQCLTVRGRVAERLIPRCLIIIFL